MFEQAVAIEWGRGNRTWTTAAGAGGELLLVAVLAIAPLIAPQGLPRLEYLIPLVAPPSYRPARPPQPLQPARAAAPRRSAAPLGQGLLAPTVIPAKAAIIVEDPPAPSDPGSPGIGVPGGIGTGSSGGLMAEIFREAHRPPSVPSPAPVTAVVTIPEQKIVRIKLGGQIQHRKLLRQAIPAYPVLARQARVAGTVELLAVIGTDGTVKELQLVSGHPLLVRAALDAVRQWVYSPTLLNGEPVEVLAPITVTFRLD